MSRPVRILRLVAVAAFLAIPCTPSAPKYFIDMDRAELLRGVPGLAALEFSSRPEPPGDLLKDAGEELAKNFEDFSEAVIVETVHEMSFEGVAPGASRREEFLYVVNSSIDGDRLRLTESRRNPGSEAPVEAPVPSGLLVQGHFMERLTPLFPGNQRRFRFRELGRLALSGMDVSVIGFAPKETCQEPFCQGLAWIDRSTNRILRIVAGGMSADSVTADIAFVAVRLPDEAVIPLPAVATTSVRRGSAESRNIHRYSAYRVDDHPAAAARDSAGRLADDAWELLTRSTALENEPDRAIPLLREAASLEPSEYRVRFHLALALWKTGDADGAETELRAALHSQAECGPAHNLLGVILTKRDPNSAVAEFREAARLQPNDAVARFNLGQVLEKLGDRAGALDAYKAARTLDPGNNTYKARYDQLASTPESPTIRVDVRQVLVPVVVTDSENRHVAGLRRDDFLVFEDGVEQKLTGFSVETAATVENTNAVAPSEGPAPAARAREAAVRRTYLICLDATHAEFANRVNVRKALTTLFHSEQPGDAQYIILSVRHTGVSLVQNTTADAAAVLKAIESEAFDKAYASGHSSKSDLEQYRRELVDARIACDSHDPSCPARRREVPIRAEQLASQEEAETTAFLRQLRPVVEQFARAAGRRTIVLLSDGFGMVPGREAFELLQAYFPENRFAGLRTVQRMSGVLEPILRIAANHNIPVQTIDTRGLYTQEFYSARPGGGVPGVMPAVLSAMNRSATESGNTLGEISAATGGTAYRNSNDLVLGLRRAFSDGRDYYMLAYVPANAAQDGKFRAISVRLRKDNGLKVTAKRGYWATAE